MCTAHITHDSLFDEAAGCVVWSTLTATVVIILLRRLSHLLKPAAADAYLDPDAHKAGASFGLSAAVGLPGFKQQY
jgi:hypothetical protein